MSSGLRQGVGVAVRHKAETRRLTIKAARTVFMMASEYSARSDPLPKTTT